MPETIDENTLSTLLPEYYKRLFPVYSMCKWLGYSEGLRMIKIKKFTPMPELVVYL